MRFFLVVIVGIFLAFAPVANAALMNVVPSATSVTTGDLITARVVVNSQGVAINNAEAVLRYPKDVLNVISVSKSSSIFTLWVAEPGYSNSAGTVSYNGGIPTPGFTGSNGTVLTITFLAKQAGTASLSFSDAAVRANDGMGTDVLTGSGTAQITVSAPVAAPVQTAPAAPAAETPAPSSSGGATARVVITSPTHPEQDAWYADNSPILRWALPSGADAVQIVADRDAKATPTVTYRPAIVEKTVPALEDGVWYFNLRYRLGGSWSPVASYRLRIDTVAPVIDDHSFTYDDITRALSMSAAAHDDVSGVSRYEVAIDEEAPVVIEAADFEKDGYEVRVRTSGKHTAFLRAIDGAGNVTEASESFMVTTSVMDTPVFTIGDLTITLLPLLLAMAGFSLLSLLLALFAGYIAYRHVARPQKDRNDTRKKIHRAFSLLRSDIEKQVRTLHKVRTGKELSEREELLSTSMSENVTDLERYLLDKTDILD